jgi:hypothetical protein
MFEPSEMEVPRPAAETTAITNRLGIRKVVVSNLSGEYRLDFSVGNTNCGTCDGCGSTVYSHSCSCPLSSSCHVGCTTTTNCGPF